MKTLVQLLTFRRLAFHGLQTSFFFRIPFQQFHWAGSSLKGMDGRRLNSEIITCIRQLELAELERLLGLLELGQPIGKEDLHALIFFKPSLLAPNSEPLTTSLSSDQYEIVLIALTCELKDSLIPIPIY
jgi:hypothetical protein